MKKMVYRAVLNGLSKGLSAINSHRADRNLKKCLKASKSGCNCAQSILVTYGPQFGLEYDTALKLGSPLGRGIGSGEHICGAVNAAIMVIGLTFDGSRSEEEKKLVSTFLSRFNDLHEGLVCNQLWLMDETLRQDRDKMKAHCRKYLKTCVYLLDELLDL